ncbi:copper radical oxidase [Colletotrichum karsti]|uniref:Copper radical oxidase n=1 Tax=Colletotrichum karsti TaxID=1095194 RepID=A0A9P6LQA1_9PEZI|nr:copper radical oxidase [Colletotrichum karsti]KAF9880502.1 copper radical oxidase [Colletotrichum karsti]
MSITSFTRFGLMALPLMAPLVSAVAVQRRTPAFSGGDCYHEPPRDHGRALKDSGTSSDSMTKEVCAEFCKDYKYFGVEYGRECYCGNVLTSSATKVDASECNMQCSGNSNQPCGAGDRLNLYTLDGYIAPSTKNLAEHNMFYQGCHTEGDGGRALSGFDYSSDTLRPYDCVSTCAGKGYNFAGLEWGRECWCGNYIRGGHWAPESDCTKPCTGDIKSFCGEGGRLSIYAMKTPTTATVTGATYMQCVKDTQSLRFLETGDRLAADDMTATKCASFCSNYKYFGVENGRECYCANDFSVDLQSASAPETDCNTPCWGDGTTLCGAENRLNLYKSTTTAPADTTSNTAGNYQYLQCNVDNVSSRALADDHFADDTGMTPNKCASLCGAKNFQYFGLEYSRECFCGNQLGGAVAPSGDCYMKCTGDSTKICGARDRLSVYQIPSPN